MSTATIEKRELRAALEAVRHAVPRERASDPPEPATSLSLQHVQLVLNGAAEFTATDGHRLARYTVALKGQREADEILIPADQIKPLLALCRGKGTITISTGAAMFEAMTDGAPTVAFERPDFRFPGTSRAFPDSFEHVETFPALELRAGFRMVNAVCSQHIKPSALAFDGGVCRIESEPSVDGETSYELPASFQGRRTIGVNAPFVLDALKVLTGKTVEIAFDQPLRPLRFSSPDMPEYFEIVMPLRIEWGAEAEDQEADPMEAEIVTAVQEWGDSPEGQAAGAALFKPPVKLLPAPTPEQDTTGTVKAPALQIREYSERAIIITGETWPHRERIKNAVPKAHGIWHRTAQGWIFSKKHEAALRESLADLLQFIAA